MGRLSRAAAAALALLVAVGLAAPMPSLGFTGFGTPTADATFGEELVFSVELEGGTPERLELLLWMGDGESLFVAPVVPQGGTATYRWDADRDYVVPNSTIRYRWRANVGEREVLSSEGELLYDDDRPGLDWRRAQIGEATVHWYGDAEAVARRLGELSADGVRRAEGLLDHEMSGPVDIFIYDSDADFFGALGPGQREWTGAATYSHLRTIFMWRRAGDMSWLETTVVHEVTHVVFHDATDNPFHEPARWLNEGIARWSERESADAERALVRFEATGGGLLAFEAIEAAFPISSRGSSLAYAQGATMVDMIIGEHGAGAVADIAGAYREGASDAEALRAGTGRSLEELYDAYFASFGVDRPEPVRPRELLPTIVDLPTVDPGEPSVASPTAGPAEPPAAPGEEGSLPLALGAVSLLAVAFGAGLVLWLRRRPAGP